MADVFFYGMFMDLDLLRAEGFAPGDGEIATVADFSVRIGQRAALAPQRGAQVYGVVTSLTVGELERLYAAPSLKAYTPQAVLASLASGGIIAALCYNLPNPPNAHDHNADYARRLHAAALKVGLPSEYVATLR